LPNFRKTKLGIIEEKVSLVSLAGSDVGLLGESLEEASQAVCVDFL
jgi:hypothetical protein